MSFVSSLVSRPQVPAKGLLETPSSFPESASLPARWYDYTFYKTNPKVTDGEMAEHIQGLVNFQELTHVPCSHVQAPWRWGEGDPHLRPEDASGECVLPPPGK